MLDFYKIKQRDGMRKEVLEVYPDYQIARSKDLMVRAKSFYAIWDETKNLWSTDEYDVQRLVDEEMYAYIPDNPDLFEVHKKMLGNFSTNSWLQFRNYVGHLTDNSHQLDESLTFANTKVRKEDYVSKRLEYTLVEGDISAYTELMGVLYEPEELQKLEWVLGAIISGDSKKIQKFLVLYGSAGTGKSTWLMIVQWLVAGYYTTFDAKELTGNNNSFSMESFKSNPIVAIQHDGDLSKITDNSKLNSIVSHEPMEINEKNKPKYMIVPISFLIMGTNTPVKFTDAKSGLVRRLIDVRPTGDKVSPRKYQALMSQIRFELGAIAFHCLSVYRDLGKDHYATYRPVEMMLQTDVFFNFIEAHYDIFSKQAGVSLKQAYDLYKLFCVDTHIEYVTPQFKFREELKNYFGTFIDRHEMPDGVRVRSWYTDFNADRFKVQVKEDMAFSLVIDETESLLDIRYADLPAQYSKTDGTPRKAWSDVETKLSDLDTSKEHYVNSDETEIVIDFDLRGDDGEKSLEKNLEAASQWPSTYAELSKSGQGIHLHYIYEGDVSELSRIYEPGIEIKVFVGDSSLRRKLTKCNAVPVAKINSGLPLKEKKMMNTEGVKSEKTLRDLILRNLRKEIHPGTKSSIDFIHKILEDAHKSDLSYDVTDMRQKIVVFAGNSSNQALYCIKLVKNMKFNSENAGDPAEFQTPTAKMEKLVFFDCEVFKNLFVLCWKVEGEGNLVKMINPSPQAVEELFAYRLVGFNNRKYDNHILYGASMGYSNMQLYELSQKLVTNSQNGPFREAYNLSWADIFDYTSKKQSLKKYQIELGIPHIELGLPWDEPVDESLWTKVADYCANDVESTEHTHVARRQDYIAREILSDLSGLPINATTQQHTGKIVFGDERSPQAEFVYTDLSEMFPGYKYEMGKSTFKGEITGEGGYVYSEPGMYENVAVLDVQSMHPTSIKALNLFGPYTENYSAMIQARLAIKRGDYESAGSMLNGILARHLKDPADAEALSFALKIVINIVYGLTSAKFQNLFRDNRNIDNIVAKRGALFMITLKIAVQSMGYDVIHIKTDSIKIPNADKAIIEFIMDMGNEYGYTFEHEATYEKMALVNDAVYIAKVAAGRKPAHWEAIGAQFKHPYVYKHLFSKEPIEFKDLCETKAVTTALFLDFDGQETPMALTRDTKLRFVGKVGQFCPVKTGGGSLVRSKVITEEGAEPVTKYYAAPGTIGYKWLESEVVKELKLEDTIDMSYFDKLVDDSVEKITQYGDFEWFVS